jgi:membrane fusion protein, protease secretion system
VTKEGMKKIGQQQIRSGMPVTVVIKSGERTMLQYLVKPLTDRLHFAFTEE